jgi:predicted ATP-grasp superfamily ATP-dependent carboligase
VLDARLRQSLVAVRSLGSCGLGVSALETVCGVPTFASRWCRRGFYAPPHDQSDEPYLMRLEQVLADTGARVLIASSDGTVALLRRYRERIRPGVAVALAKEPALGVAVNKEQTLQVARAVGLNIPHAVIVRDAGDVAAALREIGLPAVVKPVESWVRDECHGVRLASQLVITPDEARRTVEALTFSGAPVLFQRYLTGRREAVSLIYAQGRVYARFAQWAKRTEPPLGGLSVLRQSIPIPDDIGAQAERLVRAIDLEGYSEVEFRRDGCGTPYLMEINPRLSASVEIAVLAGVDFPLLLYQWASGLPIATVGGYRTGYWMRYLAGDIRSTFGTIRQRGRPGVTGPARAVGDFCLSFFTPARYDYLDLGDPLPACVAAVGFAGSVLHRLGSHRSDRSTQEPATENRRHLRQWPGQTLGERAMEKI